jgi:adenylate cyclase, class 2
MIEVEIKVKIGNPDEMRIKFSKIGIKYKLKMKHLDIYYEMVPGNRIFARTDEALRLRQSEIYDVKSKSYIPDRTDLTYKGPKLDQQLKTRKELVCNIVESDIMDEILMELGFKKVLTVEKVRELYEWEMDGNKIELLIDQIEGLEGFYMEAEVMVESEEVRSEAEDTIKKLLSLLEIPLERSIRESYLELLLEKQPHK